MHGSNEMTNPQKQKGSAYERLIVDHLRANGFTVERTRAGWTDDRGDVHGVSGPSGLPFTVECKNHRAMSLAGWVTELKREIANAGGNIGVVVHKRVGTTDPSEQYATMPFGMLVQLLKEAGYK
jgi:hypothetical protein